MTKEGIKLLCRNSIDIPINTHISKSMASVKYIIKSFIVSCMISLTIYAQGEITSNNLDGYYIAAGEELNGIDEYIIKAKNR